MERIFTKLEMYVLFAMAFSMIALFDNQLESTLVSDIILDNIQTLAGGERYEPCEPDGSGCYNGLWWLTYRE